MADTILSKIGLGCSQQLQAFACALLGQQRIAAHHQPLAGEVRAGEFEKVALIDQRRLEGAMFLGEQLAAAATGYVPNFLAGSLKSRRSMTVAGLVPTISVAQFLLTVQALTETLAAGGYQLILGQTGYDHSREESGRRPNDSMVTSYWQCCFAIIAASVCGQWCMSPRLRTRMRETPAFNVNRLCGSGLQAIISAAQAIALGDCDVAIGGGSEAMSRGPYFDTAARYGARMGDAALVDYMLGILHDPWEKMHMGITAENVAGRYNISRDQQDELAVLSQ